MEQFKNDCDANNLSQTQFEIASLVPSFISSLALSVWRFDHCHKIIPNNTTTSHHKNDTNDSQPTHVTSLSPTSSHDFRYIPFHHTVRAPNSFHQGGFTHATLMVWICLGLNDGQLKGPHGKGCHKGSRFWLGITRQFRTRPDYYVPLVYFLSPNIMIILWVNSGIAISAYGGKTIGPSGPMGPDFTTGVVESPVWAIDHSCMIVEYHSSAWRSNHAQLPVFQGHRSPPIVRYTLSTK